MDIKETLLEEYSKAQVMKIANYIGDNQALFDEIIQLFNDDDLRVSQRASWVMSHCCDKYPHLIEPHLGFIINNLPHCKHDAVKRNSMRILGYIDVPEDLLGVLADYSFQYLADPKETVAVRCFSMTVCHNICKREPELNEELESIIRDHMPHATAGFKARGKRILKALAKGK